MKHVLTPSHLQMLEMEFDESHPKRAFLLVDMADVYRKQSKLNEALAYYQQVRVQCFHCTDVIVVMM